MTLQRISRIEAVNSMLVAIGEAPVNSLGGTDLPQDAAIASFILDEVNREVQSRGWHFNTEYNVTLELDSNGYIPVANNALNVTVLRSELSDTVTMRGSFLYNTSTDTKSDRFVFDADLDATIVYLLEFTTLPNVAREYIVARASRLFQERVFGNPELTRSLLQREEYARGELMAHETLAGDDNYLDFPDAQDFTNRYI